MAWIDHGYRLPLTSRPPNHLGAGNHLGARTYADWLGRSVQELVKMGAMRRWLPEVCNFHRRSKSKFTDGDRIRCPARETPTLWGLGTNITGEA